MKKLALNMDSINGYLECAVCEEPFLIAKGIPATCPTCSSNLWGIAD